MESPQSEHCQKAIESEMSSLKEHGVWDFVPRPRDKNVVGNRWVFKIKYDNNGNIAKYKARLVCQGFTQEEGIDYTETFAPVIRYESVRSTNDFIGFPSPKVG
jgi:hypothetical protein